MAITVNGTLTIGGASSELLTNGDFSSGSTGWSLENSPTFSGGQCVMNNTGAFQSVFQNPTLTDYAYYLYGVNIVAISGGLIVYSGTSSSGDPDYAKQFTTSGIKEFYLKANTLDRVKFYTTNPSTSTIDDCSARKIAVWENVDIVFNGSSTDVDNAYIKNSTKSGTGSDIEALTTDGNVDGGTNSGWTFTGGGTPFSESGSAGTAVGAGQTGQLALGRSLTGDAGTGAGAGQAGVGTVGTSIPFIGEGAAGTAAGAGQSGQLITGIALEGDAGAATGAGQVGQGQFGGAFSGQGSAGVGSGVGQSGILALGHVLNGGTGTASGAGQPGAAIIGASFIGEGQSGTGTGAGQAGQLTAGVDGSFRGEGAAGVGTGEGSIGQLVLGFILEGNTGTGTGAGYAGSILTDDGVVSEWMTASLRMINTAYRLGDPARYLPTAGGTLDVTVVHTQDQIDVLSEAGVGVRAADHLVFVRKNEVAAPAVGDRVIEYGKIFTVERVEQFNEHEWVMNVRV